MIRLARCNVDRNAKDGKLLRYQYELTRHETDRGTEDVLRLTKIITLHRATKQVLKTKTITGRVFIPEHVRREVQQRMEGKI